MAGEGMGGRERRVIVEREGDLDNGVVAGGEGWEVEGVGGGEGRKVP